MIQTFALFVDAYRELNSKRLFWFVLALSLLVVGVFAIVGNNEKGLTILTWTIEFPPLSTRFLPTEEFYKIMFVELGLSVWLTWIATILALVSTASVFPDFLAGGAIELSLSKPVGRLRLFLTKYAAALLFVALQVTVFSVASLLVLGLRGGVWEPGVLLAIPLVVLVFSYLFAVCVFFGVLFRSTIAALLLTLLVWGMIFLINSADAVLVSLRVVSDERLAAQTERVRQQESRVADLESIASGSASPSEAPVQTSDQRPKEGGMIAGLRWALEKSASPTPDSQDSAARQLERERKNLESRRTRLEEIKGNNRTLHRWYGLVYSVKTLLPKTSETTALMERWIIDTTRLEMLQEEGAASTPVDIEIQTDDEGDPEPAIDQRQIGTKAEAEFRSRSVTWIIGTSLLFECVVLGAAARMFIRRDF